jgi:hypothetical protein
VKLKTWRSFRNEGGWSCPAALAYHFSVYTHTEKKKWGRRSCPAASDACKVSYSTMPFLLTPEGHLASSPWRFWSIAAAGGGLDKPGRRPAGTLEPRRRRITPRHAPPRCGAACSGRTAVRRVVLWPAAVRGADRGLKPHLTHVRDHQYATSAISRLPRPACPRTTHAVRARPGPESER